MSRVIVRIDSREDDVEMLCVNRGTEIWKKLSLKEFTSILRKRIPGAFKDSKPKLLDPGVIAVGDGVTIIRRPSGRRIVSHSGKAYEINFPNALYVVRHSETKVGSVDAYVYFSWQGKDTQLYLMPMPNMTMSQHMCLGTADRSIKNRDVCSALERIIDASYTHDHVDNMVENTSTVKWFRHLKTAKVKKKEIKPAGIKVADLVS